MGGPPYFDWRLDRWKIGFALALWLGLVFSLPGPSPDPQGLSPIARPGQRPVVGSSSRIGATPALVDAASPPSLLPRAETTIADEAVAQPVPMSAAASPLSLTILEQGRGPLGNSTPLFFGESEPDALVEILLAGRRYAAVADSRGYWQFAPTTPLPVGMTWVEARQVSVDGVLLAGPLSVMALIGPASQPIPAPGILMPLSSALELTDSTPPLSGIGAPTVDLRFYAQSGEEGKKRPVGKVAVALDGTWRWQMRAPLTPGETTLWAVAQDTEGKALTRSWPVRLRVASNATPSAHGESSGLGADATR